ncbi:CD180 antigen [Labeo rohita]|uniref:CD180 antigen n=1 Tax=Labeo rohita TaxID=84645 RepID=A0ABQ8MSB1_LABRO|nr:CD180 antigen [Labeo rohita]
MSPDQGYGRAKKLLKKHFGSKIKIAAAYMEKVMGWPMIKSEDIDALESFSIFLRNCCNVMEDLQHMEDMNVPSNLRLIVIKLLYKFRERWRAAACELLEHQGNRAMFSDLYRCKIVNTYAFLDPGSSASFCTEHLMRKLNLTGTRSSILLRTLGQEKSIDTFILRGLQISNLDGQTFMDLPELYTQGSMPIRKNNILTQEDLKDWPYLEGIKIPSINEEVELLISINASNLMEPWEIINSQGGGPYAVRTLLGWVVNGPLRGGNSDKGKIGCPVVTANRISVARLEDLLIAQYNQEFNEKLSEDDLLQGPYLTNSLLGVLTRFRQEPVALIADIQAMFHQEHRSKAIKELDLDKDDLPVERVLGLHWCTEEDNFVFKLSIKEHSHTRRGMLSVQWKGWLANLPSIAALKVDRCVKPKDFGPSKHAQLHHFSDARENGYGTVSYLRNKDRKKDLLVESVITDLPPFTNVGVNYFGPFEVKKGRSTVKRYGVSFTCMASWAVHMEMAYSLNTDSCINAIRHFLCRGQVVQLRSDNGTNFVGAELELREAVAGLDHTKIQHALLSNGLKWIFNPPAAPHVGGIWKRLIRLVKNVLYSTIKQPTMDDESFQTLLCETEAILNSRPITKSSDDVNDLEALTPNHILLKSKPLMAPGLFNERDLYIRKRWRQVQYLLDLFWKRWVKEYLPLLQERQKWIMPRRSFTVGDIVVIMDPVAPCGSWLLGRIIKTYPDKGGFVRFVQIKTKPGQLDRPVSKICLLLEAEN